uniref:Uncharacterized protein n=1 Tax=Arundo donax TaxID=35708 RepID=A0A0A9FIK4_ARUDO
MDQFIILNTYPYRTTQIYLGRPHFLP